MATTDRMISLMGSQAIPHANADNLTCFLDLDRDAWCFRDLKGCFTYVNPSFLTMVGAQAANQLFNKPLEIIDTFAAEHIENLNRIERQVLSMKKPIVIPIWGISFYGYRNPIINISINPFFSINDNSLIGTYWQCSVHNFIPLRRIINCDFEVTIKSLSPYDYFSKGEWAVIWLFFIGWNHKDIAFCLGINKKSSEQRLSRAYKKIGVKNFNELHRVIIDNYWDAEVPVF